MLHRRLQIASSSAAKRTRSFGPWPAKQVAPEHTHPPAALVPVITRQELARTVLQHLKASGLHQKSISESITPSRKVLAIGSDSVMGKLFHRAYYCAHPTVRPKVSLEQGPCGGFSFVDR